MISLPVFVRAGHADQAGAGVESRAHGRRQGARLCHQQRQRRTCSSAKLDLATGNGTVVGTRTLSEYVLPGNTKSWLVDATSGLEASATMQILSTSDAGDLKSTVALETGLAANQDARSSR